MKREIKFRAWDVDNMIPHDRIAFQFAFDEHNKPESPVALMQWTGLKDKNGVEIYEGDIVSAWSQGYNHKGEIRWRLSGAPQIIIYPAFADQGFWTLHGSELKPGSIHLDVTGRVEVMRGIKTEYTDDGVEVIGNIYENPDLRRIGTSLKLK